MAKAKDTGKGGFFGGEKKRKKKHSVPCLLLPAVRSLLTSSPSSLSFLSTRTSQPQDHGEKNISVDTVKFCFNLPLVAPGCLLCAGCAVRW